MTLNYTKHVIFHVRPHLDIDFISEDSEKPKNPLAESCDSQRQKNPKESLGLCPSFLPDETPPRAIDRELKQKQKRKLVAVWHRRKGMKTFFGFAIACSAIFVVQAIDINVDTSSSDYGPQVWICFIRKAIFLRQKHLFLKKHLLPSLSKLTFKICFLNTPLERDFYSFSDVQIPRNSCREFFTGNLFVIPYGTYGIRNILQLAVELEFPKIINLSD